MTVRAGLRGPGLLAWAILAVLLLYLVLVGGGFAGVNSPYVRLLNLILAAIILSAWLVLGWFRPGWRPTSALWPAILAVLLAFAVSTLFSQAQWISVQYLAYAVLLAALYLLLVRVLAHPALGSRVFAVVWLLWLAICLLYIAVVVDLWIDWWGLVGRITVPPLRPAFAQLFYANPGGVAAMVSLLLAPGAAWLLGRGRHARRLVLPMVVLTAVVVLLTGSRGAWLGFAVATVVVALVAGVTRRGTLRATWRRVPRSALVVGSVALLMVAIVVGPGILRRFGGGGEDLRVTLAATTLRMFAESPVLGVGPGMWAVERASHTEPAEVDYYIPHAHNLPLQVLAEFGLVGGVASVLVAVFLARLLLPALRGGGRQQLLAISIAWSLAYLAGQEVVDFHLNLPAVIFAAGFPVAALDAATISARPRDQVMSTERRLPRPGVVAFAIALGAALYASLAPEAGTRSVYESALAADKGEWRHAFDEGAIAVGENAGSPPALYAFALAGRQTGALTGEAALEAFRQGARVDDFAHAWLNIAALEVELGNEAGARDALGHAIRLGWQQPAVALPAGWLYATLGDDEAAVEMFGHALLGAPWLVDDAFWSTRQDLEGLQRRAIALAAARGSADIRLIFGIALGRGADIRAAAGEMAPDARSVALLAAEAWTGNEDARRELIRLAEDDPSDAAVVAWCALLAQRAGDEAGQERFLRWSGIMGGGGINRDVVVTDEPIAGRQVPGPNANFHGWYTYRQPLAWDLLVPGLPKLTLK